MTLFEEVTFNRNKIINKAVKKMIKFIKLKIKSCIRQGEYKTDMIGIENVLVASQHISDDMKKEIYEKVCKMLNEYYNGEIIANFYMHHYNYPLGGVQVAIVPKNKQEL